MSSFEREGYLSKLRCRIITAGCSLEAYWIYIILGLRKQVFEYEHSDKNIENNSILFTDNILQISHIFVALAGAEKYTWSALIGICFFFHQMPHTATPWLDNVALRIHLSNT